MLTAMFSQNESTLWEKPKTPKIRLSDIATAAADLETDVSIIGLHINPTSESAYSSSPTLLPAVMPSWLEYLDKIRFEGAGQNVINQAGFTATRGDSLQMWLNFNGTPKLIIVYGLGRKEYDFNGGVRSLNISTSKSSSTTNSPKTSFGTPEPAFTNSLIASFYEFGLFSTQVATEFKNANKIAVTLPDDTSDEALSALIQGIQLGSYRDLRFKSPLERRAMEVSHLEQVTVVFAMSHRQKATAPALLAESEALVAGLILATQLGNSPGNILTPERLASCAQSTARQYGMDCRVYDKDECAKLGLGGFLGVAQGSSQEPKFIHMKYSSGPSLLGAHPKKIALVGKSITYDSGGLTHRKQVRQVGRYLMREDMCGGACLMGIARALGQIRPEALEVHFLLPSCESMIDGTSCHPGDILTMANAKTVQVLDTDCEGRLAVADALVFAEKLGVDAIIDITTVSQIAAEITGSYCAPYWANDNYLAAQIERAANRAGEKMWRMPIIEECRKDIMSPFADLNNISGESSGKALSAALFLREFITDTPWAHVDIAGTAFNETSGATAFGVRSLVKFLQAFAGSQ